ncbi:MAG TPA: WD40 repeat domain-containing protein [Gemmataceae bacterium]|nr:WD40 repeat domain-containing protein [Gemmataceae bacterium]
MKLVHTSLLLLTAVPSAFAEPGPIPRAVRLDPDGNTLPDGAVARLGSTRFQDCYAQRVTVTPDGLQAVCVDENHVRVWDLRTGNLAHTWPLPEEPWSSSFWLQERVPLDFIGTVSDDGRTAVRVTRRPGPGFIQDPPVVAVYNVPTGKRQFTLTIPNVPSFSAVAISPDGKALATADFTLNLRIRVWDALTGAHRLIGESSGQIDQLVFLDEGRKGLAVIHGNETVHIYDVAKAEEAYHVKVPIRGRVHPSRNGKFFIVYEGSAALTVYDAATGKPVEGLKYPGPKDYANPRALADDGMTMVCYRMSGNAIWDFKTGTERATLPLPGFKPTAFGPGGKTVVLAGAGVRLFDAGTGKELAGPDEARNWGGDVGQFGWSVDGKTLCVPGQYRGKGYVFDPETGKLLRQLDSQAQVFEWFHPGHYPWPHNFLHLNHPAREMPFTFPVRGGGKQRRDARATPSGDDRLLALRTVKVQGWHRSMLYTTNAPPPDIPPKHCFDVAVHDRYTGVELFHLDIPVAGDVCFSADTRRLAVLEPDRLRVLDAATGKELLSRKVTPRDPPPAGQGFGITPAFSPDNRRLAVNNRDGTILIWDVSVPRDAKPLAADELPKLWDDLGSPDASRAWQAVHRLLDDPGPAVKFLLDRVKPAKPPDAAAAKRLLAELDSPEYRVREAAMKKVLDLGDVGRPFVEESLKTATGAELRTRLESLRSMLPDKAPPRGDDLRRLRALAVLEQARTKEARERVEEMANGFAAARVTVEAKITRDRLVAWEREAGR